MKMFISFMLLSLTISAHAASQNLSNCKLQAAAAKDGYPVETVAFGEAVSNPLTGALQRTATLNSLTVILIEGGAITAINIYDTAKQVYFTSEFKNAAMYANSDLSAQVFCK